MKTLTHIWFMLDLSFRIQAGLFGDPDMIWQSIQGKCQLLPPAPPYYPFLEE